ncbi:MAG: arsenate reductase ArsC [Acidobacteria bacterium]|nr:arsenate reductase ArsC [Acidobacteriota bacterium]
MPLVLFACVHNAGRSQMAAAWFNRLADPAKARAISAGTRPADRVHPEVVDSMREVGMDLEHAVPGLLTGELAGSATLLVTMGCGEECPYVPPGLERLDWPVADPKGASPERVTAIRDEIRRMVAALVATRGWEAHDASRSRGERPCGSGEDKPESLDRRRSRPER